MGDENPIRTLGDYSKPSHEGYRNTIELPIGNNVVPLRSDTIRLVQNGCLFHGLRSKDPNQHIKDFLKLVDSLDLDRSIFTWDDLTTLFLAQFFLPRRTTKLYNNILMFQQHHEESLSKAWTRFKDLLQKVPHHGIDLWLQVQIFYDHVNPVTRRTIDQLAGGKLCDLNPKESWAILEDLALYDNEKGLVSEFMASQIAILSKFEVGFKRQQGEMTNKTDIVLKAITNQIVGTLPSDTVMNPKLGTYPVSSTRSYPIMTHNAQHKSIVQSMPSQSTPSSLMNPKLGLVPQSSNTKFVYSKEDDGEVMFNEIIQDDDEPQNKDPNEDEEAMAEEIVEYFDTFPTRIELTYHRKLDPRENANGGISNFTERIKGMHVFVGNFTYVVDFMIFEDISSIIDPRTNEVAYKMPHNRDEHINPNPVYLLYGSAGVRVITAAEDVLQRNSKVLKEKSQQVVQGCLFIGLKMVASECNEVSLNKKCFREVSSMSGRQSMVDRLEAVWVSSSFEAELGFLLVLKLGFSIGSNLVDVALQDPCESYIVLLLFTYLRILVSSFVVLERLMLFMVNVISRFKSPTAFQIFE
ncbi:zinc finger, CCHC-type containing protein [Tanacetum coccineum]|uniref:Zinc finger, CCHC-type containing protein n=1 Tax=Tanacetum coccineum TaxID=301880 RepID=A0ABQ5FYL5_9ASTR